VKALQIEAAQPEIHAIASQGVETATSQNPPQPVPQAFTGPKVIADERFPQRGVYVHSGDRGFILIHPRGVSRLKGVA